MKILYVGHTYTVRANQAKIVQLARQENVEITLVTPHAWRGPLYENKTDSFDRSLAANVDHRILRAAFIGKESAYFYTPAIFSLIKAVKADIVHVEQGTYAMSYAQILWGLERFSPASRTLFFTWWNLHYTARGIKGRMESYNLKHSTCAIAGNSSAREVLLSHGFTRPIHVLPQLGIDPPTNIRTTCERLDHRFTIGYAGRISKEKGVLDLVLAVNQMKHKEQAILYFVGAGDALEDAKHLAKQHSVTLMHHPAVRNESLGEHLLKMDVLVLPSRTTPTWVEQFGHILLEAMALGVPVIGSSSGEIPNVIGDAGLVFEEGNTSELAMQLDTLQTDENTRVLLARLGRERVTEHFTHEKIARSQMEIYEWMLREGQPISALNYAPNP